MGCEGHGAEGFLYRLAEGVSVGGIFDDGAGREGGTLAWIGRGGEEGLDVYRSIAVIIGDTHPPAAAADMISPPIR